MSQGVFEGRPKCTRTYPLSHTWSYMFRACRDPKNPSVATFVQKNIVTPDEVRFFKVQCPLPSLQCSQYDSYQPNLGPVTLTNLNQSGGPANTSEPQTVRAKSEGKALLSWCLFPSSPVLVHATLQTLKLQTP